MPKDIYIGHGRKSMTHKKIRTEWRETIYDHIIKDKVDAGAPKVPQKPNKGDIYKEHARKHRPLRTHTPTTTHDPTTAHNTYSVLHSLKRERTTQAWQNVLVKGIASTKT